MTMNSSGGRAGDTTGGIGSGRQRLVLDAGITLAIHGRCWMCEAVREAAFFLLLFFGQNKATFKQSSPSPVQPSPAQPGIIINLVSLSPNLSSQSLSGYHFASWYNHLELAVDLQRTFFVYHSIPETLKPTCIVFEPAFNEISL